MLQNSNLTIGTAVANQSGAMEADTISKNGRSSKSQMSRKNYLTFIVVFVLFSNYCFGQSVSVQQNQQNVNINLPVIEKTVYVDRYRTVYVDRPQPKRVAKKLPAPIQLLGYLWVYPEDLGTFKQPPTGVIESINAQNMYGRDNWRIPTPDELAVLENNADKVGLGDDIYLATDHSNGVLRLVSTGNTGSDKSNIKQQAINSGTAIEISGTTWAKSNIGSGREFLRTDAIKACPKGWRLPKQSEIEDLISYYERVCSDVRVNRNQDCVNPKLAQFFGVYGEGYGCFWLQDGRFRVQKKTSNYTGNTFWSIDTFGLSSDNSDRNCVRCVFDE